MVDNCYSAQKSGYSLTFANGLGWHIMGLNKVVPMIDLLAAIMDLKLTVPGELPKFIFIEKVFPEELPRNFPFKTIARQFSNELPPKGWHSYIRFPFSLWTHPSVPHVVCEILPQKEDLHLAIPVLRYTLRQVHHEVQKSGGLFLHGGLVEFNGIGVIIAGPGDAGKSTTCSRFPSPWRVLSDDESVVVLDNNGMYRAHPLPTWNSFLFSSSLKKWNVNEHLPLRALFFLQQSKEDNVVVVQEGQASVNISQSAAEAYPWLEDEEVGAKRLLRARLYENAVVMAKTIPSFTLNLSLEGRFWKKVEKALQSL